MFDPLACTYTVIIGLIAILAAHGTLQEWCGVRVTWRITDSVHGRLWLSFGVVLMASLPAHVETLPVWLCVVTILAFTAALYVFLDRVALLPIPHVVRQTAMIAERRSTWIDNRKPVGYQWKNHQLQAI